MCLLEISFSAPAIGLINRPHISSALYMAICLRPGAQPFCLLLDPNLSLTLHTYCSVDTGSFSSVKGTGSPDGLSFGCHVWIGLGLNNVAVFFLIFVSAPGVF